MKREINGFYVQHGGKVPWYLGMSYIDYDRDIWVYYPLGISWIIKKIWHIRDILKHGQIISINKRVIHKHINKGDIIPDWYGVGYYTYDVVNGRWDIICYPLGLNIIIRWVMYI